MELLTDTYENKIELKINDLLEGKSLLSWCKQISEDFLVQTNQTKPPFSVAKLLPHRRIKAVHDTSIALTGKIEKQDGGFILKLNPDRMKSKMYYNFVLAHEIAHTYFYYTKNLDPIDISGLSPGSAHLEYLCNKIARYLLIPSSSLERDLSQLPSVNSDDFSLACLNDLLAKYFISEYTLLSRLIVDEPLWNCVFIRFKFFAETSNWKLVDLFKPRYLNSFIPQGDKWRGGKNPKNLPSAKKALDKFLRQLQTDLRIKKRSTEKVVVSEVLGEPLNDLFSNFAIDQEILIHSSLNNTRDTLSLLLPLGLIKGNSGNK